jgi:curved DNA-binding protein CbpA
VDEVRRAYRAQAKIWHPDINPDPAAPEHFRLITEAYETLADPVARANYDRDLAPEVPPRAPVVGDDRPFGDPWEDPWRRPFGPRGSVFDLIDALLGGSPPYRESSRPAPPEVTVFVDDRTGAIRIRRRSATVRFTITRE